MSQTALALFLTIMVLALHHTNPLRPVPRWMKFLVGCLVRPTKLQPIQGEPTGTTNAGKTGNDVTITEVEPYPNDGKVISSGETSKADGDKQCNAATDTKMNADWEGISRRVDRFLFKLFLIVSALEAAGFLLTCCFM